MGRIAGAAVVLLMLVGCKSLGSETDSAGESTIASVSSPSAPATDQVPVPSDESTTTVTLLAAPPVVYSGSGADVVDIGPGNTGSVVLATHDGSSNFIVNALDESLTVVDGVVNEIGPFMGSVMLTTFSEPANVRYLQVDADGAWTLQFLDPATLPAFDEAYAGAGKQVIRYTGDGGVYSVTHDGSSNFIATLYGSGVFGIDPLVNEIGPYSGRIPLSAGPALLVVNADGNWAFQAD